MKRGITWAVAGLIYLLWPLDLVPDFLEGLLDLVQIEICQGLVVSIDREAQLLTEPLGPGHVRRELGNLVVATHEPEAHGAHHREHPTHYSGYHYVYHRQPATMAGDVFSRAHGVSIGDSAGRVRIFPRTLPPENVENFDSTDCALEMPAKPERPRA